MYKLAYILIILSVLLIYQDSFALTPEEAAQKHIDKGKELLNTGYVNNAIASFNEASKIDPDNIIPYFTLGLLYLRTGNYVMAEVNFLNVIRLKPDSSGTHFNLALVYEKLGKARKSIQEYQKVILLNANPRQVNASRGKVFTLRGDLLFSREMYEEAKYEYLMAKKLTPNELYLYKRLGQIYFLLDDFKNARLEYEEIIGRQKNNYKAHYSLGLIYKKLLKEKEALMALANVIKLRPNSKEALLASKEIYRLKGEQDAKDNELENMIGNFEKFLELEPENIDIRFQLASAYSKLGKEKRSIEEYKKILAFDPDNVRVHLNLGIMYAIVLDTNNAIKEYEKVIEIDSNGEEAYISRLKMGFIKGLDFYNRNMYEEAIKEYSSILDIEKDNTVALKNIGEVYLRQKKYDQALAIYNKLITSDPDNLKYYLTISLIYEVQGLKNSAINNYRFIMNHEKVDKKTYELAKRKLNFIKADRFMKENNYRKALNIYQDLLKDSIEPIPIYLKTISLYTNLFMYEESVKEIRSLIEIEPNNYKNHLYLGIALEKLKMLDDAKRSYEKVSLNSKDIKDIKYARRRLLVMKGDSYYEKKEYYNALKEYESVYQRHKDDLITILKLTNLYLILNMYEQGEKLLKTLLSQKPNTEVAHMYLAQIYSKTGRNDEALYEYKQALKLSNRDTEKKEILKGLYMTQGKLASDSGDYQWAIRNYQAANKLAPFDKEPLHAISGLFALLDKPKESRAALLKIKEIYPYDYFIYYKMGIALADKEEHKKAIEEFEKALSLTNDPNVKTVIKSKMALSHGEIYLEEEEYDKAIAEYRKTLETDPENIFALYKISRAYIKQNNEREAEKIFKQMIDIDPLNIYTRLNLGFLYEQQNRFKEAIDEYEFIDTTTGGKEKQFDIEAIIKDAKNRKEGYTYKLTYNMNFDNNINLSSNEPEEDFYSSYNIGVSYHRALFSSSMANLSFSPSFATNYLNQVTSFSLVTSPSYVYNFKPYSTSVGASYSVGFSGGSPASDTSNFFVQLSRSQKYPTSLSLETSLVLVNSKTNSTFNSIRRSITLSISQSIFWLGTETLFMTYSLRDSKSRHSSGNQNDNVSNTASLGYYLNISSKVTTSFQFNVSVMNFLNPDTISEIKLKRTTSSFLYKINYTFARDAVVFASYQRNIGRSNIPAAEALNISDIISNQLLAQEVIISRSAYEKDVFSLGIQINF